MPKIDPLLKVPEELRQLPQWVGWRLTPDGRKMPINPKTGKAAKSNEPQTWGSFEEATAAAKKFNCNGLSFALTAEDEYVCIDLDDCRNAKNNTLNATAKKIVEAFSTFTEVSPSETGIHIWLKGIKPDNACRKGKFECYAEKKFIAMTGRRLKHSRCIEERQQELNEFHKKYLGSKARKKSTHDDEPLIVPAKKLGQLLENNLAKSIYDGMVKGRYQSQSEADLALAGFAVKQGWTESETHALLFQARSNAGENVKYPGYFQLTYRRARGDYRETTLAEAEEVFAKWLFLPESTVLRVMLAVVISANLPGDPCWLHMVGPPSSGKTELIRAVETWPTIYALTEFTPAGLVAGRDGDDNQDHSLLPQLNNKVLCIKDLTPILDLPQEARNRTFAFLRDAFDGYMARHTASVGTRRYAATFNCLTGVTPAIEKVWRNASLGERFLLFRMPESDSMAAAKQALLGAAAKVHMRAELQKAACGVLAAGNQDVIPTLSSEIEEQLAKLAVLLATMRTYVDRDHYHEVQYPPQPEGPARIVQQLYKLAQGLALIDRRSEVTSDDLRVLSRVVLDSMPIVRRQLIQELALRQRTEIMDLCSAVSLERTATTRHVQDLILLKVVQGHQESANKKTYLLTAAFRKLWRELCRTSHQDTRVDRAERVSCPDHPEEGL